MVSAAFKTVFAQVSGEDMHTQWDQVASTLENRFSKGAALMQAAKEEVLAFTAFPQEHWRQIWSTNPSSGLNKELKRRCRVVGIFPNEASVIRLGVQSSSTSTTSGSRPNGGTSPKPLWPSSTESWI